MFFYIIYRYICADLHQKIKDNPFPQFRKSFHLNMISYLKLRDSALLINLSFQLELVGGFVFF